MRQRLKGLQRINCDYREVQRKQTLQANDLVSNKRIKIWNLNIFEYAAEGNTQDRALGVSKEEYKISAAYARLARFEHLVKHGDN